MRIRAMKLLALVLALATLLAGCRAPAAPAAPETDQEDAIAAKAIYASFFPLYALSLPVFDGVPGMHLKCIVQPQIGCLRSYEMSDWDYAKVLSADAIIIGGRGLEGFEGALESLGADGPALLGVMGALTLIGQDAQLDPENASHFDGANPWLWLSVAGASEMMEQIAAGMLALDPSFEEMYLDNLGKAQAELEALQHRIQERMIQETPWPVALLHEGFVYIAEDLALDDVCTIDREPGSDLYGRDLDEALSKIAASGAKVALIEKQAPRPLLDALANAGLQVALIDTMSTFPFDVGKDHYATVAYANANAIADAFRRVNAQPQG